MRIHREGYPTLTIALIFLLIVNVTIWRMADIPILYWIIGFASVVIYLLILQFFRDPQRVVANAPANAILSPADGKIVVIEDAMEAEYFKGKRLMISIFMSPLNVHINHHPVDGTVVYKKYHPGKYLVAWHPKASTENERTTLVYMVGKTNILIRQIAGAMARRIVNYANEGDQAVRGQEMGFIKFGSRVDVFLPVGTQYTVKLGQTVKSQLDVIAHLD